jgi:alpha-L-fucosidase
MWAGVLCTVLGAFCAKAQGVKLKSPPPTDDLIARAARVYPAPRQLAWQQREIEVFVHFGLNTMTQREWGSGKESPSIFNPAHANPTQWVEAAKSINAKGLVLVCKHHDGFCLWPSAATEYSVKAAPWLGGKGDLVKMTSEACRAAGIKFGVYLSPADRHDPSFGTEQYNQVYRLQLRELLTHYGEISEVWMDGAFPDGKAETLDFPSYYSLVRELQPGAVIVSKGPDVRWIGSEMCVPRPAEWSVIPLSTNLDHCSWSDLRAADLGTRPLLNGSVELHWYPAVADIPLNDDWFWDRDSQRTLKSLYQLQQVYEQSVGRNAGLLINLAPSSAGLIPAADVSRLREFGTWLRESFRNDLLTDAKREKRTKEDGVVEFELRLPEPRFATTLAFGEDITSGQHIEKFTVEANDGGEWREVAKGMTVGWKRIVRWKPQPCSAIRVQVLASRAEPVLGAVNLYNIRW